MDDTACTVRAAIVIARFFRHETCGQCTQCREGTAWLYKLLRRVERGAGDRWTISETIESVGGYMEGQTICALSDAAAWAATGFLRRFRAEFEAHVRERRLPAAGELRAVSEDDTATVTRNLIVQRLGTPDVTVGSVNEPREREEHGLRFNEKWVYRRGRGEPG